MPILQVQHWNLYYSGIGIQQTTPTTCIRFYSFRSDADQWFRQTIAYQLGLFDQLNDRALEAHLESLIEQMLVCEHTPTDLPLDPSKNYVPLDLLSW